MEHGCIAFVTKWLSRHTHVLNVGGAWNQCQAESRRLRAALRRAGHDAELVVIYSPYEGTPVWCAGHDGQMRARREAAGVVRCGFYLPIFSMSRTLKRHYFVRVGKFCIDPTIRQFPGCADVSHFWREQ